MCPFAGKHSTTELPMNIFASSAAAKDHPTTELPMNIQIFGTYE